MPKVFVSGDDDPRLAKAIDSYVEYLDKRGIYVTFHGNVALFGDGTSIIGKSKLDLGMKLVSFCKKVEKKWRADYVRDNGKSVTPKAPIASSIPIAVGRVFCELRDHLGITKDVSLDLAHDRDPHTGLCRGFRTSKPRVIVGFRGFKIVPRVMVHELLHSLGYSHSKSICGMKFMSRECLLSRAIAGNLYGDQDHEIPMQD